MADHALAVLADGRAHTTAELLTAILKRGKQATEGSLYGVLLACQKRGQVKRDEFNKWVKA